MVIAIQSLFIGRNLRTVLLYSRQLIQTSTNESATINCDVAVVGGGIVGCATARQLKIKNENLKIVLIEKENHLAAHQSGHNSGVLHAGIYYKPGSLKAKLCVKGIDLAYDFFDRHHVPYKKVGKLIVAVEPDEVPRLDDLYARALQNGCKGIKMIAANEIKDHAPFCKGLKALWSPYTGIVDWGLVTNYYASDFEKRGGVIFTNYPLAELMVQGMSPEAGKANEYPVVIESNASGMKINCKFVITCCGLHSDRIAKMSGCSSVPKIVPFRGEYLLMTSEKRKLVTTNIYPVPDPRFPFLGVHFTPRMNGDVWLGPNAVLAYKREGYGYFDISPMDLIDSLTFSGMRKLMSKFIGYGLKEMYRGIWIKAQVKQLQRFMPDLSVHDVKRGPSGVRAQAMDENGNLVDDFVFDGGSGELGRRVLHVRNAPSPGATSSLAIAEMIEEKASNAFGFRK